MDSFSHLVTKARLSVPELAELLRIPIELASKYVDGEIQPPCREIHVLKGMALAVRDAGAPSSCEDLLPRANMPQKKSKLQRHVTEKALSPRLPHPIPYQGSKRNLAPLIAPYVPRQVRTWYEPFAGSAAMTIWAARARIADRYIIADTLEPVVELWRAILNKPGKTADRYEKVWNGQKPGEHDYFNAIRDRYNNERDPVDLLYLICRCVKNAVRFGKKQNFTQSADKRRLGMQPKKMRAAIEGASAILKGHTEVRVGDWLKTTADANPSDFVYMDPPYLGTTIGRDKRYAEQLALERLIGGLSAFNDRRLRFALSYDGMTGSKEYGPALPKELGLTRLLLHAGVSSQATLAGRSEETIESLYLSPGLAKDKLFPVVLRRHPEQSLLPL